MHLHLHFVWNKVLYIRRIVIYSFYSYLKHIFMHWTFLLVQDGRQDGHHIELFASSCSTLDLNNYFCGWIHRTCLILILLWLYYAINQFFCLYLTKCLCYSNSTTMSIKMFIEIFVFNLNKTTTSHNHLKITQKSKLLFLLLWSQ